MLLSALKEAILSSRAAPAQARAAVFARQNANPGHPPTEKRVDVQDLQPSVDVHVYVPNPV
jgi:hypothetical protein